jgi:hypothetical protein
MQALFLSDQLMDPKERAENCGNGGGIPQTAGTQILANHNLKF